MNMIAMNTNTVSTILIFQNNTEVRRNEALRHIEEVSINQYPKKKIFQVQLYWKFKTEHS